MSVRRWAGALLLASFWVAFFDSPAISRHQPSSTASIQLIAVKHPSIGIRLSDWDPGVLPPEGHEAPGDVDPAWDVVWNLPPSPQVIRVCVSILGASTDLNGNRGSTLANNVEVRAEGTDSFHILARGGCGQADALELPRIMVGKDNHKNGSKAYNVFLHVSSHKLESPPGSFTGVLVITGIIADGPVDLR